MTSPHRAPTTATVRVMYWKEIPVQVQAEDDTGKVSLMLDHRFQEGADAIAMFDGSYGTDDYLDGWGWTEPVEVETSARDAATEVAERYNEGMPKDFVARVRDLHNEGARDPTPGAIDGWIK